TMAAAVFAMGAVLVVVSATSRGPAAIGPLAQAVVLIALSNALLAALAVLFSSLSTPVLSVVYTLGLYATGWWSSDLRDFPAQMPGALGKIVEGASSLIPNLDLFNLRPQVAHLGTAPTLQLALAIGYA